MAILVAAPLSTIVVLMMISTGRSLLGEHARAIRRKAELDREELVSLIEERMGS